MTFVFDSNFNYLRLSYKERSFRLKVQALYNFNLRTEA